LRGVPSFAWIIGIAVDPFMQLARRLRSTEQPAKVDKRLQNA